MIKLGIIGTGGIAQLFVDAAQKSDYFKLTTVYSRHEETGQAFLKENNVSGDIYTDLERFFAEGDFSAVYIASPNSLHFAQAKAAILADKDVIVEKPFVINPTQWQLLYDLHQKHPDYLIFEAARHFHEEAFKAVSETLPSLGKIQGANLTYMKYSSKYDSYLDGKKPNIFTSKFAGGALQDLGVYMIYDAIAWFGKPKEACYHAHMLPSGVDKMGTILLTYPDFDVTIHIGKTSNSYLPSEIYGGQETIVMDNAADLHEVKLVGPKAEMVIAKRSAAENPLLQEAQAFGKVLETRDQKARQVAEKWLETSRLVNETLYALRQDSGIVFDDEK